MLCMLLRLSLSFFFSFTPFSSNVRNYSMSEVRGHARNLWNPIVQASPWKPDHLWFARVLVGQHVISQNICNDMMEIIRSKVLKFIVTFGWLCFLFLFRFCLFPSSNSFRPFSHSQSGFCKWFLQRFPQMAWVWFARRVLVCLPTVSLNIPHGTKLGLGNCDHLEGSPKVNLCPCGHSLCRCELRKWFQMQTSAKLGKNNRLLQDVGSKRLLGAQSLGGLGAVVKSYLPRSQRKDLVGSGVFVGHGCLLPWRRCQKLILPLQQCKRPCPQNI